MSIGSALNTAGTGLAAAARLADTVSTNVANAMTPGYARRVTELSSLALGGSSAGVRVLGTIRVEHPQVTAERRAMDAAAGAAGTLSAALERMIAAIGAPGDAAALATRAVGFETALLGAVAMPHSFAKLAEAVGAAGALVGAVNDIAAVTERLRTEADAEIGRQVAAVNGALREVELLNDKIRTGQIKGLDTAGLEDERGRVIDRIAEIVPLRTVKRELGAVALYSASGGVLLDGRVHELRFQPGPAVVTADMVVGGALGPLMQDRGAPGGPVAVAGTGTGRGLFDGGSLAALFEVRDRLVPALDAELAAYAADLVARFFDLDGSGQGLFVDKGGPAVGLPGRLALNAAVDPAQGGEVWRLRAGLAAAAPGPEGYGDLLQDMAEAMVAARPPVGFAATGAAMGSAGFAAEIAAFFGAQAARSDAARAHLTAQQAILAERETDLVGVDTDAQLQFLMLVEQAYAANARVLTVIDSLLKQLLEI